MSTTQPTPRFVNDVGLGVIRVGAREFECLGATPPHDHPHIWLDMGSQNAIVCPYCATRFEHDDALAADAAIPAAALYHAKR